MQKLLVFFLQTSGGDHDLNSANSTVSDKMWAVPGKKTGQKYHFLCKNRPKNTILRLKSIFFSISGEYSENDNQGFG